MKKIGRIREELAATMGLWQRAGGCVGWAFIDEDGYMLAGQKTFDKNAKWPSFRTDPWNFELCPQLEMPKSGLVVDWSLLGPTDRELETIASTKNMRGVFEDLEYLRLAGCVLVTDKGLKPLRSSRRLLFLYLAQTKVTTQGLKELAKLKNLERLSLQDTKLTSLVCGKVTGGCVDRVSHMAFRR